MLNINNKYIIYCNIRNKMSRESRPYASILPGFKLLGIPVPIPGPCLQGIPILIGASTLGSPMGRISFPCRLALQLREIYKQTLPNKTYVIIVVSKYTVAHNKNDIITSFMTLIFLLIRRRVELMVRATIWTSVGMLLKNCYLIKKIENNSMDGPS